MAKIVVVLILCDVGARLLGGVTALLKAEAGLVSSYVAKECLKIMGG